MLRANGLHKTFGAVTALAGMSIEVRPGEIVGLIGHNGAGKSTFVDIAAGLRRPDAGSVWVDGVDVGRFPRRARARLGIAPQDLALYPQATGRDNLRLFAGLHGLRGRRARERVDEVAHAVGLHEVLDRRVAVLSGGQQRRLQAATALVNEPPVLLLDEPTVGADVQARKGLLSVVRRHAERGAAICYTTHYLAELEDLDATLAVLAGGRIVARGTRAELLASLPTKLRLRFTGRLPPEIVAAYQGGAADAVTIPTTTPSEDLARFLRRFPDVSGSLAGVDVEAPTLDDLYGHILGHDLEAEPIHVN